MLNHRHHYYGWFDPTRQMYHLSLLPPDAKVRPSLMFETLSDVLILMKLRNAQVEWFPPLPNETINQEMKRIGLS